MQQQPLSAVVVEVVEAVASTPCLTLNQELDETQVRTGPSPSNPAAVLKQRPYSCLPTHLQAGPSNLSAARIAKLSVGREEYYTRELAGNHEEYLSGHGESPGRWYGAGASSLELRAKHR
jgi:hypothetical protein